jgi:hypothetical protein
MRAPLILFGAGYLEEIKDKDKPKPQGSGVFFTVHAHGATWDDQNRNYTFDPPKETRKGWELAAAVTRNKPGAPVAEHGRAIVLTDSDGLADEVFSRSANPAFLLDGIRWLLGEWWQQSAVGQRHDIRIAGCRAIPSRAAATPDERRVPQGFHRARVGWGH